MVLFTTETVAQRNSPIFAKRTLSSLTDTRFYGMSGTEARRLCKGRSLLIGKDRDMFGWLTLSYCFVPSYPPCIPLAADINIMI